MKGLLMFNNNKRSKLIVISLLLVSTLFLTACIKSSKPSHELFPFPDSVENLVITDGKYNFQSNISLEDAYNFYTTALENNGLTERAINTVIEGSVFSIVYDGAPNGKAVVVQGTKLSENSTNINIRYEEI